MIVVVKKINIDEYWSRVPYVSNFTFNKIQKVDEILVLNSKDGTLKFINLIKIEFDICYEEKIYSILKDLFNFNRKESKIHSFHFTNRYLFLFFTYYYQQHPTLAVIQLNPVQLIYELRDIYLLSNLTGTDDFLFCNREEAIYSLNIAKILKDGEIPFRLHTEEDEYINAYKFKGDEKPIEYTSNVREILDTRLIRTFCSVDRYFEEGIEKSPVYEPCRFLYFFHGYLYTYGNNAICKFNMELREMAQYKCPIPVLDKYIVHNDDYVLLPCINGDLFVYSLEKVDYVNHFHFLNKDERLIFLLIWKNYVFSSKRSSIEILQLQNFLNNELICEIENKTPYAPFIASDYLIIDNKDIIMITSLERLFKINNFN